jgi:hypothetical protein
LKRSARLAIGRAADALPTIPAIAASFFAMASLTVLKFSSEDCGTCHRMSNYDARVAEELGLAFVSVMLQDTETYRRYRKVLLAQYPNKEGMGWPTYLVVSEVEADFVIHGEVKGGMPKGDFRDRIRAVLPSNGTTDAPIPA